MKISPSNITEMLGFAVLRLCMLCMALILVVVFYDIITKGIGVVSWEFLTRPPVDGMTKGGIFPPFFLLLDRR